MAEFISAYTDDETNTVVTVSKDFADGAGLQTLKNDEPLDSRGRPRAPREGNRTSVKATAKNTTGGDAASKPEEASK